MFPMSETQVLNTYYNNRVTITQNNNKYLMKYCTFVLDYCKINVTIKPVTTSGEISHIDHSMYMLGCF